MRVNAGRGDLKSEGFSNLRFKICRAESLRAVAPGLLIYKVDERIQLVFHSGHHHVVPCSKRLVFGDELFVPPHAAAQRHAR